MSSRIDFKVQLPPATRYRGMAMQRNICICSRIAFIVCLGLLLAVPNGALAQPAPPFVFTPLGTVMPNADWTFLVGDFVRDSSRPGLNANDDVFGYHPSNGTLWMKTFQMSSFNRWGTVMPPSNWTFLVGDFTGNFGVPDGRDDVVGYHPSNGTLWVGTNTGSGFAFNGWATVTPAAEWTFLVGDFTGNSGQPDGKDDIFGYHPSNGTLWVGTNTGAGFSFNRWATVMPAREWTFLISDFTGSSGRPDGRPDVFGYHPSNGTLWVGTNTGSGFSFNRWATVMPAREWTFLIGDFTGNSSRPDGRPDVFGYHPSNGTLWVGTNSGTQFAVNRWATVTPARDWTFLVGRFGLSTSPDDKADVFGYHPSNGTLSVGVNEGSEFAFTELRSVTPPQGWIFMVGNIGIWQIGPRNVLEDTPIGYYPGNGTLWAASTLPDAGSR